MSSSSTAAFSFFSLPTESLESFALRLLSSGFISRVDAWKIHEEWENISFSTSLISSLSRGKLMTLLVRHDHQDIATTLLKKESLELAYSSSVSNGSRECRRGENNPATYLLSAAMKGLEGEGPLGGATQWDKNRFMLDHWLSNPEVLGCLMSLEEKHLVIRKIHNFSWGDDGFERRDAAILAFDSHSETQFDEVSSAPSVF